MRFLTQFKLCVLVAVVASLAGTLASSSADETDLGEWQLLAEGKSSSSTDDDKFSFSIRYNTRYEVQVDHDSTDKFEVMVRDKDEKTLVRREGQRSIIVRFDTNNVRGEKVFIHVISHGAIGKYRVFTRVGWSEEPLDRDISGTYDLDFPGNPAYDGTATIRQTGSTFTIQGQQGKGVRAQTFSGDGKIEGDHITFSFRTNKGERGEVEARVQLNGSMSGTYSLGGRFRGDVILRPAGSQRYRTGGDSNWLETAKPRKFDIAFTGGGGLTGTVEVTVRGSAVTANGEIYRNKKLDISWKGTGTYDKVRRLIQLNLDVNDGTRGYMELEIMRDGTLEGFYQVGKGPRRRLIMTPK